jgi:hypothetical protein
VSIDHLFCARDVLSHSFISQEGITKDFTTGVEKPIWPLSSYGAAKNEHTIIATLDESPEELRWKAVQALKSNTAVDYVRDRYMLLTSFPDVVCAAKI